MPKSFLTVSMALLLAFALAAPLSACGKKGPPEKPNEDYPHTYPRTD